MEYLRIVPAIEHTTTFSHLAPDDQSQRTWGAPSAPGIYDTLRAGIGPSPHASNAKATSAHPLEARLRRWEATQEQLNMDMLRRVYGVAEPVRRQMELKIVRNAGAASRPISLGGRVPGVHEEILSGRDGMITWEDVFTGEDARVGVSMQEEMDRKVLA